MSATVPAGPKISYSTRLGLNCTIASALAESGWYMCEPKILCRFDTVNAARATTTPITVGTQTRPRRLINAPLPRIALPAYRFDVRRSRRVQLDTTAPTDLRAFAVVLYAASTPGEWPPDPVRCFSSRPGIVASGHVRRRHPIRVNRKRASAPGFRRDLSAHPRGSPTWAHNAPESTDRCSRAATPPCWRHGRTWSA